MREDERMKKQLIFETETCSRCGGCGRYSYCQMYGDTCFKCHGRGVVLTKRGVVAQAYYTALCSLPVEKLEVGMEVWCDNIFGKSGWGKIESIMPDTLNVGCTIVQTPLLSNHVFMGSMFRVRQTPEQVSTKQMLALSYQNILSKSGKAPAWLKTIAWG